ncbi:MAG TPA: hypothetical protein VKA84_04355 [Gemmatimonadaceae bacterium]|nr:hypothetical protein [Gemmatimonadaceae bacterium]
MLTHPGRRPVRRIERYERALLIALGAPLCAWLARWAAEQVRHAPVATILITLAAGAALLAWRVSGLRSPRTWRVGTAAAELAAAALVAGWVVERRATGWFTTEALYEALLPLLVLHVGGMSLGASVARRRFAGPPADTVRAGAGASSAAAVILTASGTETEAADGTGAMRWRRPPDATSPTSTANGSALGVAARFRGRARFRSAAGRRTAVFRRGRHHTGVTATRMADALVRVALALTLAFWALTVADLLYAASVTLLLLAAALTLTLLVRIVDRTLEPASSGSSGYSLV